VIKVDDEVKTGLFFDHGLDANGAFGSDAHTSMHIAAQHGSLNVILDLVSRGVAVDPLDKSSRTPLSYAIEKNKYACVRSLIELGADIEHRDSFGRTPIMFACKLGSK
jgi:ankyrin repeat protein